MAGITRPNPLTDELTDEAKAELAAVFAELAARFAEFNPDFQTRVNKLRGRAARRPWELR